MEYALNNDGGPPSHITKIDATMGVYIITTASINNYRRIGDLSKFFG